MPRQTADIVALIIACVVGFVVMATAVTVLWLQIVHPDQDVGVAVDAIGRILGVLIGALTGYMAGRKINGNGGSAGP